MTDDLSSWDLLMDYALGQARKVLDHATEKFLAGHVDEDLLGATVALSTEWRELAEAWGDRMEREGVETETPVDDEVDEYEPVDLDLT